MRCLGNIVDEVCRALTILRLLEVHNEVTIKNALSYECGLT